MGVDFYSYNCIKLIIEAMEKFKLNIDTNPRTLDEQVAIMQGDMRMLQKGKTAAILGHCAPIDERKKWIIEPSARLRGIDYAGPISCWLGDHNTHPDFEGTILSMASSGVTAAEAGEALQKALSYGAPVLISGGRLLTGKSNLDSMMGIAQHMCMKPFMPDIDMDYVPDGIRGHHPPHNDMIFEGTRTNRMENAALKAGRRWKDDGLIIDEPMSSKEKYRPNVRGISSTKRGFNENEIAKRRAKNKTARKSRKKNR